MVRHTGEYFINVERVTIAPVLSLQPACINGTELETPQADRFAADSNASFGEKIFDITMAVTTRLRLNL